MKEGRSWLRIGSNPSLIMWNTSTAPRLINTRLINTRVGTLLDSRLWTRTAQSALHWRT